MKPFLGRYLKKQQAVYLQDLRCRLRTLGSPAV